MFSCFFFLKLFVVTIHNKMYIMIQEYVTFIVTIRDILFFVR